MVPDTKVLEVGDWTFTQYLENEDTEQVRSLKDINTELKQVYALLNELDKKEEKIELFK